MIFYLLLTLLLLLLFSLSLNVVVKAEYPISRDLVKAADKICQQQLKFPNIQINSTIDAFTDQTGQSYPCQIKLLNNLPRFFMEIEKTLLNNFSNMIQFYAIYNGNQETGYNLEFRASFTDPVIYPDSIVWTPNNKTSQIKHLIGSCYVIPEEKVKNEL